MLSSRPSKITAEQDTDGVLERQEFRSVRRRRRTASAPMIRQGELTSEIARLILAAVDGEWTSFVYDHRMLTTLSQSQMTIEWPSGSWLPGRAIGDLVDELRDVMYRDRKGTWFSAQWVLTNKERAGESSVTFNYDDEPAWGRPIEAANYADDLDEGPRADEFIPTWLRGRLHETGV